jgi:hypothetical protein
MTTTMSFELEVDSVTVPELAVENEPVAELSTVGANVQPVVPAWMASPITVQSILATPNAIETLDWVEPTS